jgi:hypothetical protein
MQGQVDGKEPRQRAKNACVDYRRRQHGFEVPSLTQRLRSTTLEYSWMFGLVPIPRRVVNEAEEGG